MKPELARAAELAAEYIDGFDDRPVSREPDPRVLRERLERALTDEGVPPLEVIEQLAADARDGLLDSAGGRFFGWVIGGGIPAAVAADWLVSAWDQNAGAYTCSPSAAIVEEIVAGWLKRLLGLPAESSYAFVTGCQMAHVTALAAARHRLLADRGWSVERQGLTGAPPIRVLVGEHHETLVRALRLLGIGSDAVVRLGDDTLSPEDLEGSLTDEPTIVSLAAGDLNRGAFDPFAPICEIAHRRGAWVHVDGAFGLWAAASPRLRPLVAGIEQADSWATDAHKWLNVPYDSGIVFVRDREAHTTAMSVHADYTVEVAGMRNQYDWGPEWSRRARGFPIYAALRTLGRAGLTRLIEDCCDRATELVAALGELDGVEVLAAPIVNQGLVRFLDPSGDHDARTERVIARINAGGEAWFGPTTWRGMRVMRISVSNFRTTPADIERVVAAVARALAR